MVKSIEQFLWSLGGTGNSQQDKIRYAMFYEGVVTPMWLKSQGLDYKLVSGPDNYNKHLDTIFWRPDAEVVSTCDVKAPRKGPKGLFVGDKEFTDDICIEYTSKKRKGTNDTKSGDGSAFGKQNWTFYYVVDDLDYKLLGVYQKDLQSWVTNLVETGAVPPPDCVESMSERARTNKEDMYYRWYQSANKEDSFMFVPYSHVLDSDMNHFESNVTSIVHQSYDMVMANGGIAYLDTFKYD